MSLWGVAGGLAAQEIRVPKNLMRVTLFVALVGAVGWFARGVLDKPQASIVAVAKAQQEADRLLAHTDTTTLQRVVLVETKVEAAGRAVADQATELRLVNMKLCRIGLALRIDRAEVCGDGRLP